LDIKAKPCKGNYITNNYSGCGELQLERVYGLGKSCGCYFKWLSSDEQEAKDKRERLAIKATNEVRKEQANKDKEIKKNLTNWKLKLQVRVQEIARLIDCGLPCICNPNYKGQIHGGHIYTKGGHAEIRFNLHNIHRQGAQSNKWNSDEALMRDKIAEEYGQEYLDMIKSLVGSPVPNLNNMEYMEAYKKACKIANSLKKNQRVRNVKERISMREEVNRIIGIY